MACSDYTGIIEDSVSGFLSSTRILKQKFNNLPRSACGIGLYLALIGLSHNSGIGAIAGAQSTPLEIAGCLDQYKDEHGLCASHKMTSPTV